MEGVSRSPGSVQDLSGAVNALNRLEKQWTPWLRAEATADHAQSQEAAYKDAAKMKQRATDGLFLRREMRNASMRVQKGAVDFLHELQSVGKTESAAPQVIGWLHASGDRQYAYSLVLKWMLARRCCQRESDDSWWCVSFLPQLSQLLQPSQCASICCSGCWMVV